MERKRKGKGSKKQEYKKISTQHDKTHHETFRNKHFARVYTAHACITNHTLHAHTYLYTIIYCTHSLVSHVYIVMQQLVTGL